VAACPTCGKENPEGFQFCGFCTAPLISDSREQRKTVTVLFCDVTGSTALGESTDPEAFWTLLARYFKRMKGIVEFHGGTVEKFIGDAVMAVFGVPVAHEDDALRACRAAAEMREALPGLGVQARIGVNTGEVVTGTEERLATGDAVNVAARLEQAAAPGEILVGELTLRLAGGAVEVDPVEPLRLKGKTEPVPASRLVRMRNAEPRHEGVFVGRESELAHLRETWASLLEEQRCELVTVVAPPGVGKSRLAAEFLRGVDARVVSGRCLPYGEGITYWPVVEVLKQVGPPPVDEAVDRAVSAVLGDEVAAASEEIAWAFRKMLEHVAAERPLVVVFDDIQWGDETFLDLIESTVLLSAGAPLLLLCMARPELVEQRPGWPGTLRLEPLPPEQADELMGDGVPADLRERIAHAAGGNPLFISEMLAMAAGNAAVEVPPTLKALLAARLDQLDEPERRVLERGSVEGEIFHRGSVQALAPEETQVTTRLAALVRHQLVRPDRAQLAGEDGYRFRHLLIRDAAYEALPKAVRADLHARFADWLDEHGDALVERDEIVGHHLEQAVRYRAELGQPDPDLADRAAARLAEAGERAVDRQDVRTGGALLERAARLVRPHRIDLALELQAVWCTAGNTDPRNAEMVEAVIDRVEAAGDHSGAMMGRATDLLLRGISGGPDATDEVNALCRAALPLEEERGDPRRLAFLWDLLAAAANFHQQWDAEVEAFLQALRYQRLAGYSRSDTEIEYALIVGPRRVGEAMRMMDEVAVWRPPGAQDLPRAVLLAMLDRFDEAWPLANARASHLREVTGDTSRDAYAYPAVIAAIEGDRELEVRYMARELELIVNFAVPAATGRSRIARELCHLGRFDEAERLLDEARAVPPPGSGVRVMAAAAEALLLAHRGELEQAEALARLAVTTAETRTDNIWMQTSTHEDLAAVLERAGRIDEAREELERALAIWEQKGCLPCAQRIREQVASLGSSKG
jgi:class 3 adenylate cyclase/tetratricopeptide (TPR) repeat protein